jgi:hypothetical protein
MKTDIWAVYCDGEFWDEFDSEKAARIFCQTQNNYETSNKPLFTYCSVDPLDEMLLG